MISVDVNIAVTTLKERYARWRPTSAIAGEFAPPEVRDAAWQPLVQTPPDPDDPSGGGGVAGEVLDTQLLPR